MEITVPNKPIPLKDINITDFEKLDYYQRLGVEPTIENFDKELNEAFSARVMFYLPVKNPNEKSKAETVFKAIVEAYETLSDLAKRRDYHPKKQEAPVSDIKAPTEEKNMSVLFHFEKPDHNTELSQIIRPTAEVKKPEIFEMNSNPANVSTIEDAKREKCKDITMMIACGVYCIPNYILTLIHCQACTAEPLREWGAEAGWEGYRGKGAPKKGLIAACCRIFCAPITNYEHFDDDSIKQNALIQSRSPARQSMS